MKLRNERGRGRCKWGMEREREKERKRRRGRERAREVPRRGEKERWGFEGEGIVEGRER